MQKYSFDEEINRKGTSCEKWDCQGGDFIPLWVADMDFKAPEPVITAMSERLNHGVFGYTIGRPELLDVILNHYKKIYGCTIDPEWVVFVPGVMPGANIACRICGGSIVYSTPMYPHIRRLHDEINCPCYEIPLKNADGLYTFDFDLLEKSFSGDMKGFVLCNPHNPVGRIFSQKELQSLVDYCEKHNLLIISDEIHSQLTFDSNHIPAFCIDDRAKMRSITLTSAAKTYNIPSLPFAFAIIPNPSIREHFNNQAKGLFPSTNPITVAAIKAAYTQCDAWRDELLKYLKGNRDYLEERILKIPELSVNHSEATYLAWVDARNVPTENPWTFFREKAQVNFSNGADFGCPRYLRINFGCTRKTLKAAFDRVEKAIEQLRINGTQKGNLSEDLS